MKSYSLTNIFDNGSLTALYQAQVIVKRLMEPPKGYRERVEAVRTG